jgi:hypothetical protein
LSTRAQIVERLRRRTVHRPPAQVQIDWRHITAFGMPVVPPV